MHALLYVICAFVLVLIIAFCSVCFAFVSIERKKYFSPFTHKTKDDLPDNTPENFPGLIQEAVTVNGLNGYFYYYSKGGDIVFFTHGYGSGHMAYLNQISTLCKNGFTVFTIDYNGYEQFKDKKGNFYTSVWDSKKAYEYLLKVKGNKKIFLMGHSWGAYTALALSKYVNAEKIVALSPFDKPTKVLYFLTRSTYGKFAPLLIPFRFLYLGFIYGFNFNQSAFKNVLQSKTKSLIFYGKKDVLVPPVDIKGDNITLKIYEDKGHNVYNTLRAEKYLNECFSKIATAENKQDFINSIDYNLITEEDEEVTALYINFLKN